MAARVDRYPAGIPFIVGNEGAERFSFYGMRAILWIYLVALFLNFADADAVDPAVRAAAEAKATGRMHLFIAGVYGFPMLGALLADRLLGKYRVILGLSLVYCVGHAVLALFGRTEGWVYTGLALIALGSGGIKPCVSANVGDQFTAENTHLVGRVYQLFYFTINFGSFFSTLLTPWLYVRYGPDVAFGVPGLLMALATVVFWAGRNRFVKVPPSPGGRIGVLDVVGGVLLFAVFAIPAFLHEFLPIWAQAAGMLVGLAGGLGVFALRQSLAPHPGFLAVLLHALRHQGERRAGQGFFDVARATHGDQGVDGTVSVLRIMGVFSMVSVFWALFDQHSSSWINQARRMDLAVDLPLVGETTLQASQIAALNPAMVMLIIPLLNFVVYPAVVRAGGAPTPLRRMTVGMFLASLSFVAVALLQLAIDRGADGQVSVLWQIWPYLILTTAEVLVSSTGLEFAYTQAPRAMKSTIMGFWNLCVTVGNLLVALLSGFEGLPLLTFFWTFAVLMFLAALVFAVLASRYRGAPTLPAPE